MLFIKRLNRTHFDVFFDDGWDNWTRVRRNHWGISYVDGKRLTREQIHELNERLVK